MLAPRRMVWILALGLSWGLGAWSLDKLGRTCPVEKVDAIVVAGCAVRPSGRASLALRRRTRLAVDLYQKDLAKVLVLTGGIGGQAPISEAEAAARLARHWGVPKKAIVLEERSTSTQENAEFAKQELSKRSLASDSILVVSDAYHGVRSKRVFGKHFEKVDFAGSVGALKPRIKGAHREVLALSAYFLLGRL